MRGVGFDRDEPPRGERECGGRLRPSPDLAFRGLSCWGSGFASGIDARRVETRHAARREARKPARSVSGEDARRAIRHAITLLPALNYRFPQLRRTLWQLAGMSCRAVLADTSDNQGFTTRFLHRACRQRRICPCRC